MRDASKPGRAPLVAAGCCRQCVGVTHVTRDDIDAAKTPEEIHTLAHVRLAAAAMLLHEGLAEQEVVDAKAAAAEATQPEAASSRGATPPPHRHRHHWHPRLLAPFRRA